MDERLCCLTILFNTYTCYAIDHDWWNPEISLTESSANTVISPLRPRTATLCSIVGSGINPACLTVSDETMILHLNTLVLASRRAAMLILSPIAESVGALQRNDEVVSDLISLLCPTGVVLNNEDVIAACTGIIIQSSIGVSSHIYVS